MQNLKALKIHQPFIALFGSGTSVNELSKEEFELIKSRAFVVTINYAPIHLKGHLNMWSDRRVSEFFERFFETHPKEVLLLAQKQRVSKKLAPLVDYWFSRTEDNLKGNYTIIWALQLLKKYFPEKTILLFGVDMYQKNRDMGKWYDQYTDFDRKKRGVGYNLLSKLDQCAKQIARYCPREGILNCNPKSQLDYFEKRDWRSLFKLRILHLCVTPLAGAPAHLSEIINKYTDCESVSVLKSEFINRKMDKLRWNYDVVRPSSQELQELVEWADLIHFHRKIYPAPVGHKKAVLQYHSPPNGYRPGQTDHQFNHKKLVIAQYHPRYYTDAFIVPNLIDIWSPRYLPAGKQEGKIKIFYSWATEVKGGWADKGSDQTRDILKRIQKKYGPKVIIKVLNNRPYEECMSEKRTAHICIDECVTGSYHLQSLEGCAVGALTFNNLDEKTLSFLKEVTGQEHHPFEKADLNALFQKLCYYIEHPERTIQKGKAARQWMENHWDPKKLVHRYLKAYYDVMIFDKVRTGPEDPAPAEGKPPLTILPKKPSVKTFTPASGRPVTELFQCFRGQDIYIFGTGPSLFNVDPEEFRDKICFGINYAFEAMPFIDFHFIHVIETYEVIRKLVDNRKLVLPETLVPQWHRDSSRIKYAQRIVPANEEAFIYPIQDPSEKNINRKTVSLRKDARIFTWSTTTHSAIHLAAFMGAKNIYLIGMDYALFPDRRVHFNSRHDKDYGLQNWNANNKHRQGDIWLKEVLADQQVSLQNLSRQFAKKMENEPKAHHPEVLSK